MALSRPELAPSTILAGGLCLAVLGIASASQSTGGGPTTAPTLPPIPSYGTADAARSILAVSGVDITGASLLYVIDTESRRLSVYQALGGSESTSSLRWVGARNIDLDLRVDGFNDKSQFKYSQLEAEFAKNNGQLDTVPK